MLPLVRLATLFPHAFCSKKWPKSMNGRLEERDKSRRESVKQAGDKTSSVLPACITLPLHRLQLIPVHRLICHLQFGFALLFLARLARPTP